MNIKFKIKHLISFLLHGERKPIYATITTSTPNALLEVKHIVVTGGGRGLGFAMAKKFVQEGARVLIAGRNEDVLVNASKEIGCEYEVLDIQKTETFNLFFENAAKKLGKVDTLVNNAGISLHEPSFFDVTEETFDQQFDTNLKGTFFLTQCFVRSLIEKKLKGDILFISSVTGGTADIRPYGLTKAGINSLTQGLAYLLAPNGIRVNAISPNVTASDMTGYNKKDDLSYDSSTIGRVYLPEEIAEIATFILSPTSACISGQIITCDNASTVNARWK